MIKIREMKYLDIDKVFEIEKSSFYIPWSKKSFMDELKKNKLAEYLVAIVDNEVVGYAGIWFIITEGHITNIAVEEKYRNQGVGSTLLDELINICISRDMIGITLEVSNFNTKAIKLYEKKGFKIEGIRKNYYADIKADALIMWKMLDTSRKSLS